MKALPLIVAAAVAWSPHAWAKPKGCFTAREEIAEQVVRHGVRLREGLQRCEELGYADRSVERWRALDEELGQHFAAQVALRAKAFDREFEHLAQQERRQWDGRIVSFFRHRPLTESYCRRLEGMVAETVRKGWTSFKKQAESERGEIRVDYRICG